MIGKKSKWQAAFRLCMLSQKESNQQYLAIYTGPTHNVVTSSVRICALLRCHLRKFPQIHSGNASLDLTFLNNVTASCLGTRVAP